MPVRFVRMKFKLDFMFKLNLLENSLFRPAAAKTISPPHNKHQLTAVAAICVFLDTTGNIQIFQDNIQGQTVSILANLTLSHWTRSGANRRRNVAALS